MPPAASSRGKVAHGSILSDNFGRCRVKSQWQSTVLAETQSTIQPLVPYLDTLRWVLIAIALIGIAVTIHARLDDWKRGQR